MPRKKKVNILSDKSGVKNDIDLPQGWLWVRLADIATIVMGNSPPGSSYNTSGHGVPLINGPTAFETKQLGSPAAVQFTESPTRYCEVGDLLVCVRGSTGRTNIATFRACIGRGIASVRCDICQPYLNYFITSRANFLFSIGTGSAITNITLSQLGELSVPLPPLSEQARIVAAVEASLADIDAGIAALERAREDIPRLRAAILRSAVFGELTRTWRETEYAGENGAEQLSRILIERSKGARVQRSGSTDNQPSLFEIPRRRQTRLPEPKPTTSISLPPEWTWATIGQLCDLQLGRARTPRNRSTNNSTPYLRVANITDGGLDLTDVMEMDFSPREREIYQLRRNDIIMSESSGSPRQVGKPAIWQDELPICCFQNHIIRLRTFVISSEYVFLILQYCYFNGIYSNLTAGMGINHLGTNKLACITIPLAPENEQLAILAEARIQIDSAKDFQSIIDENLRKAKNLRNGVLLRAFRGDLIPEEVADESVLLLLERIQSQRKTDRLSQQSASSVRKVKKMTVPDKHRELIEIIREHPAGITPEDLFNQARNAISEVDDFYAALALICDQVFINKPIGDDAYAWPVASRVIIRPKD